jgi:hypothetical protein
MMTQLRRKVAIRTGTARPVPPIVTTLASIVPERQTLRLPFAHLIQI